MRMNIAIRIGAVRGNSQPCGASDRPFEKMPVGPNEGLVVKTGNEQRRCQLVYPAQIEPRRWPAIDAGGHEAIDQRNLRRFQIGFGVIALTQPHQRVGFFGSGGHDPTRAMILEAAPDQLDAVGQQGRGQRVAGMAAIFAPVKPKAQAARPINQSAVGQPHQPSSGFAAVIA